MMEILTINRTDDNIKPTIALKGNSPNPFNRSTVINYTLSNNSFVTITIRDFAGKIIRTLINEKQPAGERSVLWDGTNDRRQKVPSGIYIYSLQTEKQSISGKMVFIPEL